jgi:hypothetical protein
MLIPYTEAYNMMLRCLCCILHCRVVVCNLQTLDACLRRPDTPQPDQGGAARPRMQRSKSWSDVAAAFPVAIEAVRMEDIEVGNQSGRLQCRGKDSPTTLSYGLIVSLDVHLTCMPLDTAERRNSGLLPGRRLAVEAWRGLLWHSLQGHEEWHDASRRQGTR